MCRGRRPWTACAAVAVLAACGLSGCRGTGGTAGCQTAACPSSVVDCPAAADESPADLDSASERDPNATVGLPTVERSETSVESAIPLPLWRPSPHYPGLIGPSSMPAPAQLPVPPLPSETDRAADAGWPAVEASIPRSESAAAVESLEAGGSGSALQRLGRGIQGVFTRNREAATASTASEQPPAEPPSVDAETPPFSGTFVEAEPVEAPVVRPFAHDPLPWQSRRYHPAPSIRSVPFDQIYSLVASDPAPQIPAQPRARANAVGAPVEEVAENPVHLERPVFGSPEAPGDAAAPLR